ncbi:MAG: bifunctional alpha,alpha-trehalose-phosphate synthase (UDP-forming)/trehalose-phosphatase [Spirochaetales bacterium]|nr:bifunctional alpha,alpha-trehalose-phosphate synthase (UDP-forming)/trehalose-phosphatase [Spirochaetales bacterium]
MQEKKKILIASHRLPVTVQKKNGEFTFTPSVGGVATGLKALAETSDILWVGTPGLAEDVVTKEEKTLISEKLIAEFRCFPVFLSSKEIQLYYNGFANNTIWPLFHYFQVYTQFEDDTWECYQQVNRKFFDVISRFLDAYHIAWIHDYHLMLLPELIRQSAVDIRIGYFLHIPFPSYEIFRLLPQRREIVDGLLGSDFIGFHTFSYLRHFMSTVLRLKGYTARFGTIDTGTRNVRAEICPMGIDYRRFAESDTKGIRREMKNIMRVVGKKKIILSIDRLDYTKGISHRLRAFELFLQNYPEYREKVVLIMVAVPSRITIGRYRELKEKVDRMVGKINGAFTTMKWSPIWYMYKAVPFDTMMAMYKSADVALLTPLRDGMNLIAKEYIAAKTNGSGTIIISEMAGVAEELSEALHVNPHNISEIAVQIKHALEMTEEEKVRNLHAMQERLKKYDVFKWAQSFIERLLQMDNTTSESNVQTSNQLDMQKVDEDFQKAEKRTIILDYDGTLVPFKKRPEDVIPEKALVKTIQLLAVDKKNDVIIISGRTRKYLSKWFEKLNLTLITEHGVWMRERNEKWVMPFDHDNSWKQSIRHLLDLYTERTPGTFVEEKEYSLVWHFRNSDPEFAALRLSELKGELLHLIANMNLGILEGNKVIEIKSLEINKGRIISHYLFGKHTDFILCMGDDTTDEYMFQELPPTSWTVKIGEGQTHARYRLFSHVEAYQLLRVLSGEK